MLHTNWKEHRLTIYLALAILLLSTGCGREESLPTLTSVVAATPSVVPSATPMPPTPTLGPPVEEPVIPVSGLPQGSSGFPWWNDSLFYQIFVRSFYDSNGDGIGDLNGVTAKLDYLNDGDPASQTDLGVTGIWLMPIFPSPSYHGYDVTDYYNVNPDYGTLDDFRHLLEQAHQRGIRVIIDMVFNHTSSQHPWFVESQNPDSPYRNWYIWSDFDPGTRGPDGQIVWHPGPGGSFYYGLFWEGMPDLNYDNPDVTSQMEDVSRFWLEDLGVDGFRLDGARYLVEEGDNLADTPANHAWFKKFRKFYKAINPQALTVGEVWTSSFAVAPYVKGDELDLAFEFDLAKSFLGSTSSGRADKVENQLGFVKRSYLPGQFATFLTNHDMDRAMSQLGDNISWAKNAATMLLTSPGVPFIYYGEEIGMTGKKPDEWIRTPMQWTSDSQAGFTDSLSSWEPVNQDYSQKNVAIEQNDPDSLLWHYRELIQLRNRHLAMRVGEPYLLKSDKPAIFAILRATQEEAILAVINLSAKPIEDYTLQLAKGPLNGSYRAAPLFGEGQFEDLQANANGGVDAYKPVPVLEPGASLILQLQPYP